MNYREAPPPGRRLGKLMAIAAWLLGLAMLTLLFGNLERSWLNPNQQPVSAVTTKGVQEVTLKANRQGHYLVSGSINDIAVDFLLDTGATDVAISENMAQHLGLQKGLRGTASTANGNVTVYATRIQRLQIGSIILYDVPASINPSMGEFILLGMSALRQVEFTQRDNLLTLRNYPNS
ncbi:MAG: TIGR02281 family clan AA aspartic protease [Pseudomonadales bacterium]|nr:TIGR02281 family clan AA aspartic protease [Pseudomonadales bacterium]MCP5215456.1 TIGR02281 family clan AA aspartic protease [Pseudomonadales bacterium]